MDTQEYGEFIIYTRENRVEWKGSSVDLPFRVTHEVLLEGSMEYLFRFGPFEDLGDDPTMDHMRLFRRKSAAGGGA